MAAYAAHYMFVLWLLVAFSYWNLSLLVIPHTPLECTTQYQHEQTNETSTLLYELFIVCKKQHCIYNMNNNVHLCSYDKGEHFLSHKDNDLCSYLACHHFSSQNKYQLGSPIKWWEGICFKNKRSNVSVKARKCYANVIVQIFSKKPLSYAFIQRTKTMAEASSTRNMDICVMGENEIINTSQKRTTSTMLAIAQKKAKNKKILESKYSSLWLGFQALNLINKQKELPMESGETTRELMKRKIDFDEAKEIQNARPSFPYVPQREWPSKREDGKEGQHYNLTQLPFDIEVDENGYSFDYQVSIHFELGEQKWERDHIMHKVKERIQTMNIELGDLIGEPIAIMCFHKSTTWSGTIKLHLKNPHVDAKSLLQGTKAFIITLDNEKTWRGKICKSYDVLALNNLLSVKITSDTLIGKEWYNILEEVVLEGFDRTYEYEITNVQKKKEMSFAWIVATSPEQAKKNKYLQNIL